MFWSLPRSGEPPRDPDAFFQRSTSTPIPYSRRIRPLRALLTESTSARRGARVLRTRSSARATNGPREPSIAGRRALRPRQPATPCPARPGGGCRCATAWPAVPGLMRVSLQKPLNTASAGAASIRAASAQTQSGDCARRPALSSSLPRYARKHTARRAPRTSSRARTRSRPRTRRKAELLLHGTARRGGAAREAAQLSRPRGARAQALRTYSPNGPTSRRPALTANAPSRSPSDDDVPEVARADLPARRETQGAQAPLARGSSTAGQGYPPALQTPELSLSVRNR